MAEETRKELGTEIKEKQKHKTREPDLFKVVLLNDDYTTMDFVVWVIQKVFHKPAAEATKVMMDVHKKGRGVVGRFPYDIARTKTVQVKQLAKENEYPLECVLEKE